MWVCFCLEIIWADLSLSDNNNKTAYIKSQTHVYTVEVSHLNQVFVLLNILQADLNQSNVNVDNIYCVLFLYMNVGYWVSNIIHTVYLLLTK